MFFIYHIEINFSFPKTYFARFTYRKEKIDIYIYVKYIYIFGFNDEL